MIGWITPSHTGCQYSKLRIEAPLIIYLRGSSPRDLLQKNRFLGMFQSTAENLWVMTFICGDTILLPYSEPSVHSILGISLELTSHTEDQSLKTIIKKTSIFSKCICYLSHTFICWLAGWSLEPNSFKSWAREKEAVKSKQSASLLMNHSSQRCVASEGISLSNSLR